MKKFGFEVQFVDDVTDDELLLDRDRREECEKFDKEGKSKNINN